MFIHLKTEDVVYITVYNKQKKQQRRLFISLAVYIFEHIVCNVIFLHCSFVSSSRTARSVLLSFHSLGPEAERIVSNYYLLIIWSEMDAE